MRNILFISFLLFLSACCNSSCDCEDDCKKSYLFSFVQGAGEYAPEDIDTLQVRYKFEGIRNYDTSYFYRINGSYSPNSICAGNGILALEKNIPDNSGKLVRVESYKVFTAVDSFLVDGMDITVTKSGEKCCKCVSTIERKFQLDSIPIVQHSLIPVAIPVARKK